MSEFDKEAEREKLREKYERDREKRQSTQVMSDLLLKGATMTNRHCDTCGDPIFRYEDQEFCPTCRTREGERGDAPAGAEDVGVEASEVAADEEETGVDAGETGVDTGTNAGETPVDAVDTDDAVSAQEGTVGAAADSRADRPDVGDRRTTAQGAGIPDDRAVERTSGESGLQEAHDSLVRTIVKFARTAEATDDPRRAREVLAAAREAAETLQALRR